MKQKISKEGQSEQSRDFVTMDKSVDTDMENATPETKYFKMMMADNEIGRVIGNDNGDADSIIGGQTIASLMDDAYRSRSARDSSTTTAESLPKANDAEGSVMSIVGCDDVSTLANDTVNETTRAFFTGNGDREDSKPRIRLFKEYNNNNAYKTPEKKKRSGNEDDDDDQTQPETPPGMIQVPSSNRSTSSHKKKEGLWIGGDDMISLLRSKRVYVIAGVLALILFVSIVALGAALGGVRGNESNEIPSAAINSAPENNRNEFLDSWPDLGNTINNNNVSNNNKNNSNNNNESDSVVTDLGDQDAVVETPRPSSAVQTSPPTTEPTVDLFKQFTFDDTMNLLIERGALSSKDEMNPDSPQYYATEWVSQDPSFYGYSQDRVMQRWTLALLAKSLDSTMGVENPLQRRKMKKKNRSGLLQEWLSYTDECTWFTSSKKQSPCDKDGKYQVIDLHDMSLGGTLPSELAMLSDSLMYIQLDGNELLGSIPKELERLTNLVSLRLRRNKLEEDLSIDFGKLVNLKILDLGENGLTGYLPYNVLYLNSPTEIHLDSNKLIGEIPWSIGELSTLITLALDDNNLSGWVPDSLADLVNLKTLTLGNNKLKGTLPSGICLFNDLEVYSADCVEQGCECCTECATTNSPSSSPTDLPTSFPSDSPSDSSTTSPSMPPSSAPVPTFSPTVCVAEITVLDFCFAPSANIGVSFTNCNIKRDDWVGIYRVSETLDTNSMDAPELWSWTCGTRNCREAVTQKTIPLNDIHGEGDKWPLEPGIYVAVLAKNTAMPYKAYAVSESFVVASQC